jgi:hypothetical protein
MKRSDIDDQHVIDLAQAWRDAQSVTHPGVLESLVAEGVPHKLAVAKIEHLCNRGYLEYGTSCRYAWPTGKQLEKE